MRPTIKFTLRAVAVVAWLFGAARLGRLLQDRHVPSAPRERAGAHQAVVTSTYHYRTGLRHRHRIPAQGALTRPRPSSPWRPTS